MATEITNGFRVMTPNEVIARKKFDRFTQQINDLENQRTRLADQIEEMNALVSHYAAKCPKGEIRVMEDGRITVKE